MTSTTARRRAISVLMACAVVVSAGSFGATASAQTAPGTVLESGPLDPALAPAGAASSYLVRYSTLRTSVDAGQSTGTVFVPAGDVPAGGFPVVSFGHGTVGVADECAPSTSGATPDEQQSVDAWLKAGYAVVATDYAGLGTPGVHSYLDGPAAGANMIDIVRAAHAMLGKTLSPKWIATGLSQGGNAAYFAAHTATERAPELDYRGAVAVAGPTQLEKVLPLAGPGLPPVITTSFIGYTFLVLAGLSDQRPDLNIASYLTPLGKEYLDAATTLCPSGIREFRRTHPAEFNTLFTKPLNDPALLAVWSDIQRVPVNGYDRPLLITQSVLDVVVPAPLTLIQTAEMKAAGTDFDLLVIPDTDHIGTLMASMPASLDFARRVMG